MKGRDEFIPLLRAAIAQGDTEAMLALFNDFNSWDRHLGRPDLIPRAEAEGAFRRAAELGNPDAIFRLASILTRGGPFAAGAQHAKWQLGQIILEGPLLPRDVARAVKLLGPWSQWDYDTRLQIVRLLAENPKVEMDYPEHYLYSTIEDAELGEPSAMDALIALKLSGHVQFADKAGGCALAGRAAKAGDAEAARYLDKCRAN